MPRERKGLKPGLKLGTKLPKQPDRENNSDALGAHKRHLANALDLPAYAWIPHSYENVNGVIFYYIQGILMSVWHRESGLIEHIPIIFKQDEQNYNKHRKRFEQAARAMQEE